MRSVVGDGTSDVVTFVEVAVSVTEGVVVEVVILVVISVVGVSVVVCG